MSFKHITYQNNMPKQQILADFYIVDILILAYNTVSVSLKFINMVRLK